MCLLPKTNASIRLLNFCACANHKKPVTLGGAFAFLAFGIIYFLEAMYIV